MPACRSASASFTIPGRRSSGFVLAIVVAGLCGYLVGLLSFRVRGAYFVIVTISFAEVVRLVALNWVELTQGPLALTNIPSITIGLPGLGDLTLRTKLQNYYLVLCRRGCHLSLDLAPGPFAFRPRHARADGKRNAGGIGRHRRDKDAHAGGGDLGRDRRRSRQSLRALHPDHRSRGVCLHQYGDDGDHGHHRRQGIARRSCRRRHDLRTVACVPAPDHGAGGAMDRLWRRADRHPVRIAARHRAVAGATVCETRGSGSKRLPRSLSPNATPRSMRDDSSRDGIEGREGRRALRGARCALGHELYGRRGRDRQPDRTQRRRQDDGVQRRHRLSGSNPRRRELSRDGTQRIEAASDRRSRTDPHLPAHQRVSERHRLRQSAGRAASPGQGRACSKPFWACRARGRRSAACGNAPANWSNGLASNAAPTISRARCPTASSGLSAWRWRWPPSRRCCCSTSRSPA